MTVLRIHPLVVSDVRNAVDWYDRISPGLGDRFSDKLRQSGRYPEGYAERLCDRLFGTGDQS